MAPGCTIINDHSQSHVSHYESDSNYSSSVYNTEKQLNQIPLPSNPPPELSQTNNDSKQIEIQPKSSYKPIVTKTTSSKIIQQTIMKQKRLSKIKNTDLRKKILLKRTFNLVCEMMDQENGIDTNKQQQQQQQESDDVDDTQEKDNEFQETLIINLNESEKLDSTFQDGESEDQFNYIDLENFNYANLLENDQSIITSSELVIPETNTCVNKNKTFLSDDFFNDSTFESNRPSKKRRSSADDDTDFDDEDIDEQTTNTSENNFYLFNDLTNAKPNSKKRSIQHVESDSNIEINHNSKKFKESIHIVT